MTADGKGVTRWTTPFPYSAPAFCAYSQEAFASGTVRLADSIAFTRPERSRFVSSRIGGESREARAVQDLVAVQAERIVGVLIGAGLRRYAKNVTGATGERNDARILLSARIGEPLHRVAEPLFEHPPRPAQLGEGLSVTQRG